MDLMKALTSQYMKEELPQMNVGDTVRVHVKIKEGARERVQAFEGTIIARNEVVGQWVYGFLSFRGADDFGNVGSVLKAIALYFGISRCS